MATVDSRDYVLSRATVLTEGYKGLLAVNGASVAAMLAFIAQISGKSEVMLRASFIAVVVFSVGIAVAMLVPYLRYHHSNAAERRERKQAPQVRPGTETIFELAYPSSMAKVPGSQYVSWWLYVGAQYLSVLAFLVGFLYLAYTGYEQAPALNKIVAKDCKSEGAV